MHPHTKLTTSLVIATALWLPSFSATLAGDLDVLVAALRFVAAFVITQVAVGVLTYLYDSYRAANQPSAEPAQAE